MVAVRVPVPQVRLVLVALQRRLALVEQVANVGNIFFSELVNVFSCFLGISEFPLLYLLLQFVIFRVLAFLTCVAFVEAELRDLWKGALAAELDLCKPIWLVLMLFGIRKWLIALESRLRLVVS